MKINLKLHPAYLAAIAAGWCLLPVLQAAGIIVASEDFENDLEAIGPGNGAGEPSHLGPPEGDAGVPGRWVTNAFQNAPGINGDTNANLRVSGLSLGDAQLLPGEVYPHATNTGFQAFYECRDGDYSMGGILTFTDEDGNPIVAETGDRLVGEMQVLWEDGGFAWALVSSIDTLRQEQAATVWSNSPPLSTPPYHPTDIPTAHQGGPYSQSISGMISMSTPANGLVRANIDNGSGQVAGVRLEDDFIYPYQGANTQFQKVTFDYTVGSNLYTSVTVEQFVDPGDPGMGVTTNELRVFSDASAIPVGAVPDTIEAIVFAGGDGLNAKYFLDAIQIELIPLPVEGVPFTDVVATNAMEMKFLSEAGETYDLEFTHDPVGGSFSPTRAATLTGNGGEMFFIDPTGTDTGRVYRIVQQ